MPFAVAAGIFLAVALTGYVVLAQFEERATVRASLRQLDDYAVDDARERDLLDPLGRRVVSPVIGSLTSLGRRFLPVGQVESARHKLVLAGFDGRDALDRFLAARVIGAALVPVAAVVFLVLKPVHGGLMPLALFALVAIAGVLGPDAWLNRRVEERKHQIRIRLPDMLDLLTISVEAGLGFDQAVDRTVVAVPGPMSDEFTRMLGAMRAGASRADSLRAMVDRTDVAEVRSFVLSLVQADTFGVSIGRVLRSQAEEMRIKRRQLAQEQAQKAPVKMLVPMVFCIFPSLFVVVIGPAIINILHNFK